MGGDPNHVSKSWDDPPSRYPNETLMRFGVFDIFWGSSHTFSTGGPECLGACLFFIHWLWAFYPRTQDASSKLRAFCRQSKLEQNRMLIWDEGKTVVPPLKSIIDTN